MNKELVVGTIEYKKELLEKSLLLLIEPLYMESNDNWTNRAIEFMSTFLDKSKIPQSTNLSDILNYLVYNDNEKLKDYVMSIPGMTVDIMCGNNAPDDSILSQHGYMTMPFTRPIKQNSLHNIKTHSLEEYIFLININNLQIKIKLENTNLFNNYKILEVKSSDFIDKHVISNPKYSIYKYIKMYENLYELHKENTNQMIEIINT